MGRSFLIFEQVSPPPPAGCRFRIAETYMTIDGPRTRLTNSSFSTLADAQQFVLGLESGVLMLEAPE